MTQAERSVILPVVHEDSIREGTHPAIDRPEEPQLETERPGIEPLRKELASLERSLDRMFQTLAPVLMPEHPVGASPELAQVRGATSPLGDELDHLREIVARVEYVHSRIDL